MTTRAQSVPNAGLFPLRRRQDELNEADKAIKYSKLPKTIEELGNTRTLRNEELPVTLQSEAFDVGFAEPVDYRVTRRLDIF